MELGIKNPLLASQEVHSRDKELPHHAVSNQHQPGIALPQALGCLVCTELCYGAVV